MFPLRVGLYTTVSFVSQEEIKCHHSEEHPPLQDYKVILLPYAFPLFFLPSVFRFPDQAIPWVSQLK